MKLTKAIYCILIFLLFSKVFETGACMHSSFSGSNKFYDSVLLFPTYIHKLDSCTSFNKKIPQRFIKDGEKMPCVGDYSAEWCMNGGTCYVIKHQDKFHYHCTCLEHFSGDRCIKDNRVNESEMTGIKGPCDEPYKSIFCLNGGACYTLKFDGDPEYHCECPADFNGYKCEYKTFDGFYGLKRPKMA